MKSIKVLTITFCVLMMAPLMAQVTAVQMEYNGARLLPIKRTLSYENIKGSPYHDDRLMMGYLISQNGDSTARYMRYDGYTEEMEYVDKETLLSLKNPQAFKEIYLNGLTYVYRVFPAGREQKGGFLIRLVDGTIPLYKRIFTIFEEAAPGQTPYHKGDPDRFTTKGPEYYYSDNGGQLTLFVGKNSELETLFGDESDYYESYMKKNKLKIKKEEDMVELFKHLNEKTAN